MSKALVTLATGQHLECLDVARPGFVRYAERHGYVYIEAHEADENRPPSWTKVQLLLDALQQHEMALWLDADVVIVQGCHDMAQAVSEDAWQAMVIHTVHLGFDMGVVPSCGVWLVRKPMQPILEQVWQMTQYLHHPWWEQAAMHELLGYVHNRQKIFPVRASESTPLRERTHFLPEVWNSVDMKNPNAAPYFMHMAGLKHQERMRYMRYWQARSSGVDYGA